AAEYRMLKEHLLCLAFRRSPEDLAREFGALPFEPYAPVRRQLLALLRTVNGARKRAGLALVGQDWLRMKRAIYRPFGEPDAGAQRREAAYRARFPAWRGFPRAGGEGNEA